ncbi:MAG: hypothetical protein NTW25_13250 [Candidatus Kapabacteria bacterium]|nr:hypothetical protein [Candidatus Kapabacteria bacterium]
MNYIKLKLLICFLIIINNAQSSIDTCLTKGAILYHDSTLVLHYKLSNGNISVDSETICINYIDFTPKNEQLVIGSYKIGTDITTYNTILVNRDNKWLSILNDSNKRIYEPNSRDPYKNSYTTREITSYKIKGDYVYLLCGGIGNLIVLDSNFKQFNLNTAYILKINMFDLNDKQQIFLSDDYYATDLFFKDNSWVVIGNNHLYWYNSTFLYKYNIELSHPIDIPDYYFIHAYPVTKDSIYLLFAKDKYNIDSSKIDYRLYFTSDGAKTFKKVTTPVKKVGGLFFIDSKIGYYSGDYADSNLRIYSKVFITNDGGISWTPILDFKTYQVMTKFQGLQFSSDFRFANNGRTRILSSLFGFYYISNNYGTSWNQISIFKDSICSVTKTNGLYGNFNTFTLNNDILYIPFKDNFNYTYFTYTNPNLLDVATDENNSKYDLSTSKLLVTGDYFYINNLNGIIDNSDYQIFNYLGEIVKIQRYLNNKIDISFLANGTYILRIENKTFIFIKAE